MASKYEQQLAAVLAKLKSPPVIPVTSNIRRTHRTEVPREKSPAVHVIDGDDAPGGSRCARAAELTVAIFVRGDDASAAADALKLAVIARVRAAAIDGVSIKPPRRIAPETEIADKDVTRIDINFPFTYEVSDDGWGF